MNRRPSSSTANMYWQHFMRITELGCIDFERLHPRPFNGWAIYLGEDSLFFKSSVHHDAHVSDQNIIVDTKYGVHVHLRYIVFHHQFGDLHNEINKRVHIDWLTAS